MQKNKAFSVAEILLTVAIIGILSMIALNTLNGAENLQKDFNSRYNMLVPKLTDMASLVTQNSDTAEDWWTDSNALSGLDCTGTENKSECLKRAFMSVSRTLQDCASVNECFADIDTDAKTIKSIFANVGGLTTANMAVAKMPEGATLGFLYNDWDCLTEFKDDQNGTSLGCGLIFIDVNGDEPPNRLPTKTDDIDANTKLFKRDAVFDRYLVAVTRNGIEPTSTINISAGCANGETYVDGKCSPTPECPISDEIRAKSEAIVTANATRANSVTQYFPLGEEEAPTCYSARCRDGLPPTASNLCNTPCPQLTIRNAANTANIKVQTIRRGGLFYTEGGDFKLTAGTVACCIPIETQADLGLMRTNLTRPFCLTNDITMPANWTPIGTETAPFKGQLYGNGYKIRNLTVKIKQGTTKVYAGLFGFTDDVSTSSKALVRDLWLENVNINITGTTTPTSSTVYVGALSGLGMTGRNVITSGNITIDNNSKENYAGGINGAYARNGLVNAINNVNLNIKSANTANNYYVGGALGGGGDKTVNSIVNNGTITVSPTSVHAKLNAGGIIGGNVSNDSIAGTITRLINNGTINSQPTIGKVTNSAVNYVGGIIGFGQGKTISETVNNGNITSSSANMANNYVGGIVGAMGPNSGGGSGTINRAVNYADAMTTSAKNNIAGAIGGYTGAATAQNVINYTTATSSLPMFGNATSVSNAFYLTNSVNGCKLSKNLTGCAVVPSHSNSFGGKLAPSIMPPQLKRYCGLTPRPANCYDVLNTVNRYIPSGDNPVVWAYRMPVDGTAYNINNALVFRWQCHPYRDRADGGLDCCRPSYADWEERLPVCPAKTS